MSIEVKDLTYIYEPGTPNEKTALKNVNLTIHEGEFIGIIGHTGSGKSTLIQHLNGLIQPSNGTVLCDGEDIFAPPAIEEGKGSKKKERARRAEKLKRIRQKVGLVFQYPEHQLFEMTVEKDIAFGPNNMGLSAEEVSLRVDEAMRMVGLSEDYKQKSPFELSGGQKRRVAIAGVLAMKPEYLILDEPTAGLDPRGRDEILAQIEWLQKEQKTAVILVSHSMEDVAKHVDRIIAMGGGQVRFDGTPAEVFAHGDELREIGLDIPQVTQLGNLLRENGFELPETILNMDQMEAYLLKVFKR
ncbi:MAG: energy-coupling factor transporter ATPase [Lachnospiraceae bacterium]|nr:energy-coupling factor transporter ATPase [Lachnospiraceae bacterium]